MMLSTAYYRRFGLRRIDQLISPVKAPLDTLQLPRMSIYHYIPDGPTDMGPASNELVFRNVKKAVGLQFISQPESFLGNPRLLAASVQQAEKQFYIKNRKRYRRMRNLTQYDSDLMSQVAYSYSLISKRQFYLSNKLTPYYQWFNVQKTAFNNIARTLDQSIRQHYIPVRVPANIPSPGTLNRFTKEMTIEGIRYFDSPEKYFLLELWRWITDNREYSIFKDIKPKDYGKINLLFVDKNSWFVLNLGKLDSWRQAPESEQATNPEANKKGSPAFMLAKMFLRGMMDVVSTRSASIEDLRSEHDKYLKENGEPIEADDDEPSRTIPTSGADAIQARSDDAGESDLPVNDVDERALQAFKHREARRSNVYGADEEFEDDDVSNDNAAALARRVSEIALQLDDGTTANAPGELPSMDLGELEAELDRDFEVLGAIEERVSARKEAQENEVEEDLPPVQPVYHSTLSPDQTFMALADEMAERGEIAGREYRQFERLSEKYKDIVLPSGETLVEAATIKPETLVLKAPVANFEMPGLPDKSYIGSTLDEFDKRYIRELLDKDFAAMIMALPNAGMAVTDVKTETEEDVGGKRKNWAIRVAMLNGKPTTLHATYPVPDDYGRFVSGGVKFRYRKQQAVSMPIKKLDERRVALTSYYGKLFLTKPEFKVHDYSKWLFAQIDLKDQRKEGVSDLDEQSKIDPRQKVPLTFAYIGGRLAGFKLDALGHSFQMDFTTDAIRRDPLFPEALRNEHEHDGSRLIGKGINGDYLLMEFDNRIIHLTGTGGRVDVGFIEDLLGLSMAKAPVEFTELAVMGDGIPIGVILGYYHGFNWLLRRFKPKFRRIPLGTRSKPNHDEFGVTFADQTLVFSKRDSMTALIFAGWNKFKNGIKNYSLSEFNDQEIYLNLFEDVGISYRRLSELMNMKRMFVDPISRGLLIEMGEPTVFDELLIRGTEMLTQAEVPFVADRIRGYERFAGAFYHQVVRAVRRHDNRYGKASSKLDFNPNAVEMAILTDPAKMMVDEINPIDDLKQIEAVSFSGTGGRNSRSVGRDDRIFLDEHKGAISEATVDNEKVGSNAYMPANPKLNSLRGTVTPFDPEHDGPTSLISTSMLVSPASDGDDPKRVN